MKVLEIFLKKKVLITGHTGFKGSWLASWLKELGALVTGVALEPPSQPSLFKALNLENSLMDNRLDIRDEINLKCLVKELQPDFVFHLAAQPIVRQSYLDPVETYHTNVLGTLNLLEALRTVDSRCDVVMVTSDKCYDNVEWVWGYRETDALGGPDPYSASKGAAELVIRSHVKSFFPRDGNVRIAISRAGNVIGGGDWAANRIVPDCVRSWSTDKTADLRNPKATRPWQHVLEPLSGYLMLASALRGHEKFHGEPFNFGPPAHQNHTVLELVKAMAQYWDKVQWNDISESDDGPYESGLLKLNCDKALHQLHWKAVLNFNETVEMTTEWYRSYYNQAEKASDITKKQIQKYTQLWEKRRVV
jgi:CDP-glucose 4,6-dehydratase